ncbi:hypothetical protein ACM66Z_00170 [Sulfurovum sp. ST-21]|uniref:Uncharacterized protein n=1 Tax=Sulfurovum indicum TaxID=2779528 RepID=A0A7M1S436_9BACT|nr:hypothetical protein [Sulfurovum indicum]QOR61944.1 hypothetical protein IMZ28_00170 [Sulfurovum indicum]
MLLENQQLTYYNNKDVEIFLKEVLSEASLVFKELFTKNQTAALILIGGYGRGEGGIVLENGKYRPHNNLDLLYIHNGNISTETVELANSKLQDISKKYDIGIDMSAISKQKLMRLNGLVVSYDMRFGHRTLLGDSTFLKEHEAFSLYSIDPADVRQLLVNRGTLLLINRVLLSKPLLTKNEKKLIIKHAIKAIIGYGDALLYFNNAYHWSYAQKQVNMSELKNIDKSIKDLYSQAILFRFMPDYDSYLTKDLKAWNDTLIRTLSSIHLECEKINLSENDLNWENYFKKALEYKSYSHQSLRQKVKSCLYGIKNLPVLKELDSTDEKVSFMQLGARGVLSLLFPYIAYETYPEHYRSLFKAALHTKENDTHGFLKGFLTLWSKWGDTNFINVLRTYNIELERL